MNNIELNFRESEGEERTKLKVILEDMDNVELNFHLLRLSIDNIHLVTEKG